MWRVVEDYGIKMVEGRGRDMRMCTRVCVCVCVCVCVRVCM